MNCRRCHHPYHHGTCHTGVITIDNHEAMCNCPGEDQP